MGLSRFYQRIEVLVKRIPSMSRSAEHQTLAFNFLQSTNRALAVSHFAAIMAMVKLRQIQRQMLFADMMESSNHAAFEQQKKPSTPFGGDDAGRLRRTYSLMQCMTR